jgi:hypothetical protein
MVKFAINYITKAQQSSILSNQVAKGETEIGEAIYL